MNRNACDQQILKIDFPVSDSLLPENQITANAISIIIHKNF